MCAISIELDKTTVDNKTNEFKLILSLENLTEFSNLKNILIYTKKNIYIDGEIAYKKGSLIHLILDNELSKIKHKLKTQETYIYTFSIVHPDRKTLIYPDNQDFEFYTKEISYKKNTRSMIMENITDFIEHNADKSVSLSLTDITSHLMKVEGKYFSYDDVINIIKNK